MRTKPILTMKTIAIALMMTLTFAGVAVAQEDSTDTWRDSVDADDIRYLGTVMRVMDNEFELRTLEDGVMTFTIPDEADYGAAVFTGNEVQVWVDGGTVSYVATYGETVDGDADAMDRSNTSDMDAMDTDSNMDMDADADVDTYDESATASAELSADVDDDARTDASASGEIAVDTRGDDLDVDADANVATDDDMDMDADERSWDDDDRWDGESLPQTGSQTPALFGLGLLLILTGAALRFRA